jgi:hypothetical protein
MLGMSNLVSLELRWFFDGQLADQLDKWFREALPGTEISPVDPRGDIYLFQPANEDFGIKLRQKKPGSPYSLEIKWRHYANPFRGAHGTVGQVERWIKWGWEDQQGPGPKDIAGLAIPDGPWVTVSKQRWQRKYKWGNRQFSVVPGKDVKDTILDRGAAIEITKLEVSGHPYSTVLIEAFAPAMKEQEEILSLAVEHLWHSFPEPKPSIDQSYGYPRWLATLQGNAIGSERREERLNSLFTVEHEHLSAQFISNEEMGETRVTLFLTLSAGLGAAVLLAWEKLESNSFVDISILLLAITLLWSVFGYLTFLRMVNRNATTDEYKRQFRNLRSWFVEPRDMRAREILPYDPYERYDVHTGLSLWRGKGGYAELVALLNSFLTGAIGWQAVNLVLQRPQFGTNEIMSAGDLVLGFIAAALGLLAWLGQSWMASRMYMMKKKDRKSV